MMNTKKIFLVNVSKGRIGEDNSSLLGAMLITKLQLASMERVRIPEEERKDFYLYVDEFQNFVTESFAGMLSEARKYRLNLIIVHQYIGQLITNQSTAVRDSVFGNVGTMVSFRVGAADAEFLEKEFEPEFTPQDIVNLPNFRIYLKLMVDNITSRPFSAKTMPPFTLQGQKPVEAEKLIKISRRLYTRPQAEVEKEVQEWSSGISVGGVGDKHEAICSVCNKEITVPFKPQPGRPIYCKTCLDKVKSGEIRPPTVELEAAYTEKGGASSLAELGIEFEPEKNVLSPKHSPSRSVPRQTSPPSPASGGLRRTSPPPRYKQPSVPSRRSYNEDNKRW